MITRRPCNPFLERWVPHPDVWAAQSQKVRDRWLRKLIGWPQPQPDELGPGVLQHILEDAAPIGERKWAVRLDPDTPEKDEDTCELFYDLERAGWNYTRWRVWRCRSGWGWSRAIVVDDKLWLGFMYYRNVNMPVRWASEPSPVDARDLPRAIRIALRWDDENAIAKRLDDCLRRYDPSPADPPGPKWYIPSSDSLMCDVVQLVRDGDEWRLVCVGHQCRLRELSPRGRYLRFAPRAPINPWYVEQEYEKSPLAPEPYASAWRIAVNAWWWPAGELRGTLTYLCTWIQYQYKREWMLVNVTEERPEIHPQWYIMPDGRTAYARGCDTLFVRLPE